MRAQKVWLGTILVCVAFMVGGCRRLEPPVPTPPASPTATETARWPGEPDTRPPVASTPVATLPVAEALVRVQALYATNGGCRLPCWWGITPGETSWAEARSVLAPLAHEIVEMRAGDPDSFAAAVYLPQAETPRTGRYALHTYLVENGVVQEIEAFTGRGAALTADRILRTYGTPDEVYVRTSSPESPAVPLFSVVLAYDGDSFFIDWHTQQTHIARGALQACPGSDRAFVKMWPRDETRSYAEVDPENAQQARPLVEVTAFDRERFSAVFSDPATTLCLETPARLWPTEMPPLPDF